MSIARVETPAFAAMAAAMPAAYPWFWMSACIRMTGTASRCALIPSPTTRIPSSPFGKSVRYGIEIRKPFLAGGWSSVKYGSIV